MRLLSILALSLSLVGSAFGESLPFERTEERASCTNFDPERRALFGDLHVHSSYSFDSYTSGQRNDPWGAYRYAKGEAIELPGEGDGETVSVQLRRPLDFTSVTDHSELLGEINLCVEENGSLAHWTPHCLMTRFDSFYGQLVAASYWADLISQEGLPAKERSYICDWFPEACLAAEANYWDAIQRATEEHYDRSSACTFTTFVGYEYTDAPGYRNLHRNVIFRNERVTERPISSFDTGARNPQGLWSRLETECVEGDQGCDVLAIPHNPNLGGGIIFPDPVDADDARTRATYEPLVEMIQHKAASECRFDRLAGRGVDTADELCTFEQNKTDNLNSLAVFQGEVQTERGQAVGIDEFGRRNLVRNVLKDGMTLERSLGVNPFKFGFIGSTDTHNAIPGATDEDDYVGHLGRRDAGYRNLQDHLQDGPGGLAVVWAEENSRDAIFEAMRRRETYATSGTRPVVRFFGGFGLDAGMCQADDLVAQGYAGGVPMGGDLGASEDGAPLRFAALALKDPGAPGHPGTDLQRIQVIKGWMDAEGETHEQVIDVAGGPNDASVDPETCAPIGAGAETLCQVWEDPAFDPAQPAFYYARVLENPSCRWSTLHCKAAGVDPFADDCSEQAVTATAAAHAKGASGDVFGGCCLQPDAEPFHETVIQERAWTSPIWYSGR
jgi:hypothetical protein